MEAHALAAVLHREGLQLHPTGHQLRAGEHRGHPVEHVVPRLLHVVGHQIFKGEHPLHIQVPGAGNQVLLVGVLPGELEPDEVAAVVEVAPVHQLGVVLGGLPAGGFYAADGLPVLGGHGVQPHAGIGRAAPAQGIQGAVLLKALGGLVQLLLGEARLVVAEYHIGLAGEGRQVLQGEGGLGPPGRSPAGGQEQAQEQKQGQGNLLDTLHRW